MISALNTVKEKQKYLFVPSNPAANGRLHLGHISGPYLSADILARHRMREGHEVHTIFGIDAYNSYVKRNAVIEKTTPQEIANKNYLLIKEDLNKLDIHYDIFTNPLDPEWHERYVKKHEDIFNELLRNKSLRVFTEYSPYLEEESKFVADYEVVGKCPDCGSSMGGFCCEGCGGYFYPDKILDQLSQKGEKLTFRPLKQYCLNSDAVTISLDDFEKYNLSQDALNVISTHLESRNGWFKLTQSIDWGLPIKVGGERRTIASFMTEYIYNLMHGDLYAELKCLDGNPYLGDSEVKIICSIGIDNVIAQVFGKNIISKAIKRYKPDSNFLVNKFLNLEGEKFSTSRRHAIWAADIINNTLVNSDSIRFYLAMNSPAKLERNFDVKGFIEFNNEILYKNLNKCIESSLKVVDQNKGTVVDIDTNVISSLSELYVEQQEYLQDHHVDPMGVGRVILDWVGSPFANAKDIQQIYWWLKGFSLLSYPVMPNISKNICKKLSGKNFTPSLECFIGDTQINEAPMSNW